MGTRGSFRYVTSLVLAKGTVRSHALAQLRKCRTCASLDNLCLWSRSCVTLRIPFTVDMKKARLTQSDAFSPNRFDRVKLKLKEDRHTHSTEQRVSFVKFPLCFMPGTRYRTITYFLLTEEIRYASHSFLFVGLFW
jgi:hypothetical protein